MNTIAIHQPNYIPWVGYFYKIWVSDIFVIHDNVEFTKQSFTKRVYIRKGLSSIDKTYLSISLRKHSDYTKIKDLYLCLNHQWHIEHLNKIHNTYHKARYFNQYYSAFYEILSNAHQYETLKNLNEALIKLVLKLLDIETLVFSSSELLCFDAKADSLNANIADYLGCDRYISGQGAMKYQRENTYTSRGIELIYHNIGAYLVKQPPLYPIQFDHSLSILDALFYVGTEGVLNMFRAYSSMEEQRNLIIKKHHGIALSFAMIG